MRKAFSRIIRISIAGETKTSGGTSTSMEDEPDKETATFFGRSLETKRQRATRPSLLLEILTLLGSNIT